MNGSILRGPRRAALVVIAALVAASTMVAFGESYRGLYLWASRHGVPGGWALIWPAMVDTFVCVGELALFVALIDRWAPRSRLFAWSVTLAGLAVSVAGNVGHVTGHMLASRVTAAVPPVAAAAALGVGLGVLKRVVDKHHRGEADGPADAVRAAVPADSQSAALAAMRATVAAGNPLSGRQLESRFGLTRAEATQVRRSALGDETRPGRAVSPSGEGSFPPAARPGRPDPSAQAGARSPAGAEAPNPNGSTPAVN
jgi:MFS family permease